MLDAVQILPPASCAGPPRAVGTLLLQSKHRTDNATSVLGDLRHSGCLKALFPRGPADRLSAVLVNTSGGITGGDDLRVEARIGAGSRLSLTTQAAERIYRASGTAPGRVSTRVTVEAGGRLDWLPQETILFDDARLDRRLRVDLADDAQCLLVETLVFGRTAMGEHVGKLDLSDRISVWRDGQPLFIDRTRLGGDASALLRRRALGQGAVAVASVLLATQAGSSAAPAFLERLRPQLPAQAGASLIRPGLLFLRMTARDSFELRRSLIPVLALLNDGPLPRTWMI
ncbi:hypothetical protein A8B83_03515 [Rhodobacteraceae bacterium EhC02]|nr:hypothetical protein A8B83_03515 [Rhodobacteraceae bacterium EhC02]